MVHIYSYAIFDNIKPGAYEIKEITAPSGWLRDDATYTASVATGETTIFSLVNKELPGLRIIKYDRKNMAAMANVTFEIFRDSVSLGKFRTDEFGEILLTDAAPVTTYAPVGSLERSISPFWSVTNSCGP